MVAHGKIAVQPGTRPVSSIEQIMERLMQGR